MRHRNIEIFWRLAGERDDLRDLFGFELRRGSRAVVVAENVDDQCLEIAVGHRLQLRPQQSIHFVDPTMPPSSHALHVDAEGDGLIDVPHAVGGHDNDARALNEAVRFCRRAAKPFQNSALSGEQRNFRRSAWHPFGMIRIKKK